MLTVEHAIYAAIILVGIVLCIFALRRNGPVVGERRASERENTGSEDSEEPLLIHDAATRVPTPWGWPGSDVVHGHSPRNPAGGHAGSPVASTSIQRWVDHLVSSKQTTHDEAYRLHREMCLRALLEDRFHNSVNGHSALRGQARQRPHSTTEAPQDGRDPLRGGRNTVVGEKTDYAVNTGQKDQVERPLSGLRTPWGW